MIGWMIMVIEFVKYLISYAKELYRSVIKWFLHQTTNLCEMQRIAYGELKGYSRISGIENSLRQSKVPVIQELVKKFDVKAAGEIFGNEDYRKGLLRETAKQIIRVKKIKESCHIAFTGHLKEAIETIWTVRALNTIVNSTRLIKYDSQQHEKMLVEIWNGLMYPETLSGIYTRQWQIIGFQGAHPETDFRGAGILSLECFHHLVTRYQDQAKQLLSHSQHPRFDYPLACVLIDMTFFCFQLLSEGKANSHFYNRCTAFRTHNRTDFDSIAQWQEGLKIMFYDFVAAILIEFDSYWIKSHPKDILEYGKVKKEFHDHVYRRLANPECFFHVKCQEI